MSLLDKGVDGGLRAESSHSSDDATPRSKSRTGQVFSQNDHLVPSFQHSWSGSNAVHHGDGGAFSRWDVRQLWEKQQHQQQQQQQQQTSTMPHVVFADSPDSSNYGFMSTHRMIAAPHAQARGANAAPDVRDLDFGLERLRLEESMLQPVQTFGDVHECWPGSAYLYGAYSHGAGPDAASIAQSTAEMASQPRDLSNWSRYGTQTAHDNNNNDNNNNDNNSSLQDAGIVPTSSQYSAYFAAPPSARADAVPNRPLRTHSETGFNASTELSLAQQPFTSQLGPSIPIRMGQSPGRAPNNRTASSPNPCQQPAPCYMQPGSREFLPMASIKSGREVIPSSSLASSVATYAPNVSIANPVPSTRFSNRYHGMHTESNASAEHLAPEQNASLWITNLPPDTTHHELLGQIRNIGRVYCSFINGPDGCKHTTAAAKVVFYHPSAARRLLQHAAAPDGGMHIRGFRAKVTPNRIKSGETVPRGDESRVLIVTGHRDFINEATLTEWFAVRFVFQLDEARQLIRDEKSDLAAVEFRFGSYRCQAQMGKKSLEMENQWWFGRAEFGEDPCEVGETYSSHAIALQSIKEVKSLRAEQEAIKAAEEERKKKLELERSHW